LFINKKAECWLLNTQASFFIDKVLLSVVADEIVMPE
jgi:hypothetical protein